MRRKRQARSKSRSSDGALAVRARRASSLAAAPSPAASVVPFTASAPRTTCSQAWRAGAHALHLAGADDGAGPQAVLVLERALDDVRDDLHVAVAVGGKAPARLHPILVHDAQGAEAHVARVEVVGEGEGVAAREPAELGAAAPRARAGGDHGASIPAA